MLFIGEENIFKFRIFAAVEYEDTSDYYWWDVEKQSDYGSHNVLLDKGGSPATVPAARGPWGFENGLYFGKEEKVRIDPNSIIAANFKIECQKT